MTIFRLWLKNKNRLFLRDLSIGLETSQDVYFQSLGLEVQSLRLGGILLCLFKLLRALTLIGYLPFMATRLMIVIFYVTMLLYAYSWGK